MNKKALIALVVVVIAALGGGLYYRNYSAKNATPPILQAATGLYQGSTATKTSGFLKADKSKTGINFKQTKKYIDGDNISDKATLKFVEEAGGLSDVYAETDTNLYEITENFKATSEGQEYMAGFYNAADGLWKTTKQTWYGFDGINVITDVAALTKTIVPYKNTFVFVSDKDAELYGYKDTSVEPYSSIDFCFKSKAGWNSGVVKKDELYKSVSNCMDSVTSVWVKIANAPLDAKFQKIYTEGESTDALKAYRMSKFYMAWVNFKADPVVTTNLSASWKSADVQAEWTGIPSAAYYLLQFDYPNGEYYHVDLDGTTTYTVSLNYPRANKEAVLADKTKITSSKDSNGRYVFVMKALDQNTSHTVRVMAMGTDRTLTDDTFMLVKPIVVTAAGTLGISNLQVRGSAVNRDKTVSIDTAKDVQFVWDGTYNPSTISQTKFPPTDTDQELYPMLSYTWTIKDAAGKVLWELIQSYGKGTEGVTKDDATCFVQLYNSGAKPLDSGKDWTCNYTSLPGGITFAADTKYTFEVTAFDGKDSVKTSVDFTTEKAKSEVSKLIPWGTMMWDGYGSVTWDETLKQLYMSPKVSTKKAETHSALVVSNASYKQPFQLSYTMKTTKQLRENDEPNAWEVGWTVFGYKDDGKFKYLILKPNGLELGESLLNDLQEFLYTSDATQFPINTDYNVVMKVENNVITFSVNGKQYAPYTMFGTGAKDNLTADGKIGFYTEDAAVQVSNIKMEQL